MSVRAMLMAAAGAQASAAAAYRYWRIFVQTNNGDTSYVYIGEVELRGSIGGSDLTTTITPVTAYSTAPGTADINVVDNDTATTWTSANTNVTNVWVRIDLGTEKSVAQVAISVPYWAPSRAPKDFIVQGSNDGTTFTDVKAFTSVTGWTAAWKTFDL